VAIAAGDLLQEAGESIDVSRHVLANNQALLAVSHLVAGTLDSGKSSVNLG
jgi:hypothetical protein